MLLSTMWPALITLADPPAPAPVPTERCQLRFMELNTNVITFSTYLLVVTLTLPSLTRAFRVTFPITHTPHESLLLILPISDSP